MVTIHLNSKEIGKITFWNAHNHDKRYDADMRFPYNDFCIDIKDAKMGDYLIYVHLVDYKVHSGYAETVVNGKKRIIEVDSLEETMNKLHDEKNVESALEKSKELWVDILPIGIMAYIVNKSAKRKLEIREERRALKAKIGSNRPANNSNDKVTFLMILSVIQPHISLQALSATLPVLYGKLGDIIVTISLERQFG